MTKTSSRWLFRGGPIYPMNGPRLDQGALLVGDGTINFIGPESALVATAARGASVVELAGRPLFPGFCDSHLHLIQAAEQRQALDCQGLTELPELQERVRLRAAQLGDEQWVIGFGWERKLLLEGRQPEIRLLDQASPDHPVFLLSKDAHTAWLNTTGLARMHGLGSLPAGCVIDTREGAPTGLVFESVLELQRELIPQRSGEEKRALLAPFISYLHSLGITAVHDHEPPDDFRLLCGFQRAEERRVRVMCHLICKSPEELLAQGTLLDEEIPGWLCPGGAKVFMDGSLGSLTAAVSEAYNGTSDRGLLNMGAEELDGWLRAMARVGAHGVFHVIGDRAAELVLQGLSRVDWPAGTLHRLEHAQILSTRIIESFDLASVVFSVQPSHLWGDREIAERHLSPDLAGRWAYAYRDMQQRGAGLVFGSDAPVEDPHPWRGVQAAVTRLARAGVPAWNAEQALTLMEAIAAHTVNPWQLHGSRLGCGVLAPGATADLVVFNEDPFALAAEDPDLLRERMAADLTFVDGELVYQR